MPPPWADFTKPFAVAGFVIAHLDLGTGKHKDTRDPFVFGGFAQNTVMRTGPVVIDKRAVGPTQ